MWIITHDYTEVENESENAVGIASCDYEDATLNLLKYSFRLYDDDGELYYEGLSDDADSDNVSDPLDDFGKGYAGCTDISYLKNGKWVSM